MPRNTGFDYDERLGPDADGLALHAYLCGRYRHTAPSEWLARIDAGDVLVDSERAAPDQRLRRGGQLVWRRPPWDEPAAPLEFTILIDDGDVLAVAKPSGLPTLPGANFLNNTLLFQVRRHAPDAVALHRLGRWTSGVVLFARSSRARAELTRQFREREIGKRYRALAAGRPCWDAITVDRPIGPVPYPRLGTINAAACCGKPSLSRIDVLERREDSFLCDVRIATGRPHQIRIHLAAVGHPLLGDPLYVAGGVPAPASIALPGAGGYWLHAAEVAFKHPNDGRAVVVTATPPPVLRCGALWSDASRNVTLEAHEPAESR
jgi:23S rRNA pseudouridine1911/1915/1917 synthase